jgi:hypothetical protein
MNFGEIIMNTARCFVLGLLAFLPATIGSMVVVPFTSTCIQAADKKVRISVTGTGKSKSEAETDAARNARQISTSYSTISKKTSGNDKNYICTMIIEYSQK